MARRQYAATLEGIPRKLVEAAKLHLGGEGRAKTARNLQEAVEELTFPRVAEVMLFRWAEVAAGRTKPHYAAASFHGDGGGFRSAMGAHAEAEAAEVMRQRGLAEEAAQRARAVEREHERLNPPPDLETEFLVPDYLQPSLDRRAGR